MPFAKTRGPLWAAMALSAVFLPLTSCGPKASPVEQVDKSRQALPSVDKLEMLEMLRQEQYEALDARLSERQAAFAAKRIPDEDVRYAFEAFASADPELEGDLNRWVKAAPESPAATLARSFYYLHLGKIFLGDGFERYTPTPGRKKTRDLFRLSAVDALRTIQLEPTYSVAYAVIIQLLILEEDAEHDNAQKIERHLELGLKAVPESLAIRAAYLDGLQRNRRKPTEEIELFLDRTSRKLPAGQSLGPLAGYADFSRAERLRKARRPGEAIRYYDLALQSAEYRTYHFAKAMNLYELGLVDRSLAELTRYLDLWPQDPPALLARANQLMETDRDEEALQDLERALRLDPFHPELLMLQARILEDQGQIPEAVKVLKFGRVYGLFNARLLYQRGMLLVSQENYAEGLEDLRWAELFDPEEPKYRLAYAEALMTSPIQDNRRCEPLMNLNLLLYMCDQSGACTLKDIEKAESMIARHTKTYPHCNYDLDLPPDQ